MVGLSILSRRPHDALPARARSCSTQQGRARHPGHRRRHHSRARTWTALAGAGIGRLFGPGTPTSDLIDVHPARGPPTHLERERRDRREQPGRLRTLTDEYRALAAPPRSRAAARQRVAKMHAAGEARRRASASSGCSTRTRPGSSSDCWSPTTSTTARRPGPASSPASAWSTGARWWSSPTTPR